MAVVYRPLTSERAGKEMMTLTGNASYDTLDRVHTEDVENGVSKQIVHAHVRASYELIHPVINYVIAGNNAENLCNIIGIEVGKGKSLCNFDYCYFGSPDKNTKEFIPMSALKSEAKTYFSDPYKVLLFGPAYFKFAVEHFDIDSRIRDYVYDNIMVGAVNEKLEEWQPALSDYNLHITGDVYFKIKKTPVEDDLEEIQQLIYDKVYEETTRGNSTFAKLLALKEMSEERRKEVLNACFHEFIVIVPKNQRPEMMTGGRDPLDKMYMQVLRANAAFLGSEEVTAANYQLFVDKYYKLDRAVYALVSSSKEDKANYRSHISRISSKHGLIRSINLGKRQDFSGRSVIVVDPEMSIRNIGVPKKMIPKLYQYHIVQALLSGKVEPPAGLTINKVIQTTHNTREVNMIVDFAVKVGILGNGVNSVPCIIGRQPTLHKGSMSAFHVIPVSGSAIKLSPLVVQPFNADFDGDTTYLTVPISPKAVYEASTLLLHRNNLFWAKDGEPGSVPRQEIIYGLNQCTKGTYPNYDDSSTDITGRHLRKPSSYGRKTPEEAFKAICNNKLRVYDTALATNGGKTTVGRLAFRYAIGEDLASESFKAVKVACFICPKCGHIERDLVSDNCTCSQCATEMVVYRSIKGCQCPYCARVTTAYDEAKPYLEGGASGGNDINLQTAYKLDTLTSAAEKYSNIVDGIEHGLMVQTHNYPAYQRAHYLLEAIIEDGEYYDSLKGMIVAILNDIEPDLTIKEVTTDMDEETRDATIKSNLINEFIKIVQSLPENERIFQDIISKKCSCKVYYDPKTMAMGITGEAYYLSGLLIEKHDKLVKYIRSLPTESIMDTYIKDDAIPNCRHCGGDSTGTEVTTKNIGMFVRKLLVSGVSNYIRAMDNLCELGFAVAKYYAPTLNVLDNISFEDQLSGFHKRIATHKRMYTLGFMENKQYDEEYAAAYTEMQKEIVGDKHAGIKGCLEDNLTEHNGFLKMMQSGARGSLDNLRQMYACVGLLTKNKAETLNAIIEESYIQQLKPTPHFLTTYGSRRGIMDRALETAKTGYMSRQLWHATQAAIVVTEDCGTTEGLTIRRSDFEILGLNPAREASDDAREIEKSFAFMIQGRYIPGENKPISAKRARELAKQDEVTIRSILTCKNPCCQKCYGLDPSTHDKVVVGTPVGIAAAEAIGETTSQLTMKTFQSGGVAQKGGGIGSAFDACCNVVHMSKISEKCFDSYEPIAWEDGVVTSKLDKQGNRILYINGNPEITAKVSADAKVKIEVKKGDGMLASMGERDPRDYIRHLGITAAQKYVSLKLFALFKSACVMHLKHFEVLAYSMSKAVIIDKPANSPLAIGGLYSMRELIDSGADLSKHEIRWTMLSVKKTPSVSASPTASFSFEEVKAQMFNMLVFGKVDEFRSPIESIVYAKTPNIGQKINPNFIKERIGFHVSPDIVD